jgi:hypothetical protein
VGKFSSAVPGRFDLHQGSWRPSAKQQKLKGQRSPQILVALHLDTAPNTLSERKRKQAIFGLEKFRIGADRVPHARSRR